MSQTLYLVRHGESSWNQQRRIQGQTIAPELTETGVRQAEEAALSLAGVGARALYSSDAVRALQTARIIADATGLNPHVDLRLREQHWGRLQGQSSPGAWAEADHAYGPDHRLGGGESRRQVQQRVAAFLAALPEGVGPVVVVSHGDTIRSAITLLGSGDEPGIPVGEIVNGSVTEVVDPQIRIPLDCQCNVVGSR